LGKDSSSFAIASLKRGCTYFVLFKAVSLSESMSAQPPIIIEPYDCTWPAMFEAEQQLLLTLLQPWLAGPIEHVGSTAVPGLSAKPIIDIIAAVRDLPSSKPAIEAVRLLGYGYAPYRAHAMHWFCKPSEFERTHHLSLVPIESTTWSDRLAFRDALRASNDVRCRYLALKEKLAAEFKHDREGYTQGKSDFINAVLARAAD
jgi:GrpB-like predicted nucleotidyltransferase (UPF0157 family)